MLRTCLRALKDAGLKAEGATDGLRAAELLKERNFDVIVSDISMPGMNGVQLLRTLRQHHLDVPVILMTGTPALETAVKAVEYGAFRYIMKPFALGDLVSTVLRAQRIFRLAQLRRQAVKLVGTQDKQLGDRVALETSFERALETLWMAYQPIVCWETKTVFAFEALVRTTEPTIPHPGALLEAAERFKSAARSRSRHPKQRRPHG